MSANLGVTYVVGCAIRHTGTGHFQALQDGFRVGSATAHPSARGDFSGPKPTHPPTFGREITHAMTPLWGYSPTYPPIYHPNNPKSAETLEKCFQPDLTRGGGGLQQPQPTHPPSKTHSPPGRGDTSIRVLMTGPAKLHEEVPRCWWFILSQTVQLLSTIMYFTPGVHSE